MLIVLIFIIKIISYEVILWLDQKQNSGFIADIKKPAGYIPAGFFIIVKIIKNFLLNILPHLVIKR